jgi:hypothetical protein
MGVGGRQGESEEGVVRNACSPCMHARGLLSRTTRTASWPAHPAPAAAPQAPRAHQDGDEDDKQVEAAIVEVRPAAGSRGDCAAAGHGWGWGT